MSEKELSIKYKIKDFSFLTDDVLLTYIISDINKDSIKKEDINLLNDYINITKILNKNILKIRTLNTSGKFKLDFSKIVLC